MVFETVFIPMKTMQYSTHTSPPDRDTLAIQHDGIILVLEPLNGSGLAYFLVNTNLAATVLAFGNSSTGPSEDNVKVHWLLNHIFEGVYFRRFQWQDHT